MRITYLAPQISAEYCAESKVALTGSPTGEFSDMVGGDPEGFVEISKDW